MEEEDIMDAIIYTTNTGSTERYARLLSHETGLPAYSADDGACEVIYEIRRINKTSPLPNGQRG